MSTNRLSIDVLAARMHAANPQLTHSEVMSQLSKRRKSYGTVRLTDADRTCIDRVESKPRLPYKDDE